MYVPIVKADLAITLHFGEKVYWEDDLNKLTGEEPEFHKDMELGYPYFKIFFDSDVKSKLNLSKPQTISVTVPELEMEAELTLYGGYTELNIDEICGKDVSSVVSCLDDRNFGVELPYSVCKALIERYPYLEKVVYFSFYSGSMF